MLFFTADFNLDGGTDILTAGNFYCISLTKEEMMQIMELLCLIGITLVKIPNVMQTGFMVDGGVADIRVITTIQKKQIISVARHNNSIKIFTLSEKDIVARTR